MKFMKLIFVDRTYEEHSSLPLSKFYDTAKRTSEQEFDVQVLGDLPQALTQDNPWGRHQEHDDYQSLIIDLMSRSESAFDQLAVRLKHLGKESGWELAKYHVSNRFEDTIYANTLPDDWFKKQVWHNYERENALRKKSLVKIPAAAFYFVRISRDVHQIAEEFNVTEWAVRKWAKTPEWQKALDVFDYKGERRFEAQPKRDTARDNGETFQKARQVYITAYNAGEPKHKLATITGNAVGVPRRRIHDWARKYEWREFQGDFFMPLTSTNYPFEKLRDAVRRPETGHPQRAAAEGGYIDRILAAIERFKEQLHAHGHHDEYQSVNETLEELEYPLQELRKYFRVDADTHIQKRDAEIFISHLHNQVKKWKRWGSPE